MISAESINKQNIVDFCGYFNKNLSKKIKSNDYLLSGYLLNLVLKNKSDVYHLIDHPEILRKIRVLRLYCEINLQTLHLNKIYKHLKNLSYYKRKKILLSKYSDYKLSLILKDLLILSPEIIKKANSFEDLIIKNKTIKSLEKFSNLSLDSKFNGLKHITLLTNLKDLIFYGEKFNLCLGYNHYLESLDEETSVLIYKGVFIVEIKSGVVTQFKLPRNVEPSPYDLDDFIDYMSSHSHNLSINLTDIESFWLII